MATAQTTKVRRGQFSAASRIFATDDQGLTEAVRRLAQWSARNVLVGTTDLTDNSTGAAADGTIGAIPQVTKAAVGTNDAAQKAELEAAFGNVVDALKEIIARVEAIRGKVPFYGAALVDNLSGTAADGTIGAIDKVMTGVGASMAKAADVQTVVSALRDRIAQATYWVNLCAEACGKTLITDNSGGTKSFSKTFAAVTTTVSTASGADATTNAIVKATDMGTTLTAMADAVAELAAKLNACTGALSSEPLPVVAVR